jgi:hypothetical protein
MIRAITALLIAAILVAAGWTIHTNGLAAGRAEIQAKWDQRRIVDAAANVQAAMQARAREQALQSTADKIRQEKTREIRTLLAARDAALRELRDRDERPAVGGDAAADADPAGAGPAASCTGAELWRSDAAFLVWEAARADEVRAHLSECRAAYNSAREVSH